MNKILLENCIPFEFDKNQLNESVSNPNKDFIVSGVLQRYGEKNHNGRIYPKDILKREVDKYNDIFVKQNRALGELDHPESEIVNLQNVSHNIIEVWWDGDDLKGKLKILTTPSGNIARELFKCGVNLGISSRGLGSVKQVNESTVEVQDDFELVAWDLVSNPSTKGAFIGPEKLNENIKHHNVKTNQYQKIEDIIRDILGDLK
jgi:hypothetical protein